MGLGKGAVLLATGILHKLRQILSPFHQDKGYQGGFTSLVSGI